MSNYLIIFAKEPQEGRVKTRLEGYLTKKGCVSLYRAFFKDTIDLARRIRGKRKIIAFDPVCRNPRYLKKNRSGFPLIRQKGADLGRRLHNAFKFAKEQGADKTIIIGTDSPNLPAALIRRAYAELGTKDIVLGPSRDGGYYLVGLKEPLPEIFSSIRWSTDRVFPETLSRARRLKKKVAVIKKWYDVDSAGGLKLLERELKRGSGDGARWTKKLLLDK